MTEARVSELEVVPRLGGEGRRLHSAGTPGLFRPGQGLREQWNAGVMTEARVSELEVARFEQSVLHSLAQLILPRTS